MSASYINFPLLKRMDKDGKTYFISFPDLPITINLQDFMIFVFTSEDGEEEVHLRKRFSKEEHAEYKRKQEEREENGK